jgi:hypothetical protein
MSAVGIASIIFGGVVVCGRLFLVVVPAASLRWFARLIESNRSLRILGVSLLPSGGALAWAGSTGDSTLALIVSIIGWWIMVVGTFLLIIFPAAYRELASEFMPSDEGGPLLGWRLMGILGMIVGLAFVYYGALAL